MSQAAAALFRRLQAADFYHQLHADAVALLPAGQGKTWLDVGSGPGLLARLAAARGYCVSATDADASMLAAAQAHPQAAAVRGGYRQARLDDLLAQGSQADVVSAASLLAVLPDRTQGLHDLLACVAPDGCLLLIETTPKMRWGAAWRWLWRDGKQGKGRGSAWLLLWAYLRRGRLIMDCATPAGWQVACHPLLGGLVGAWIFRRLPG